MVNRMPGSNLYGGTSSAAGGKGSATSPLIPAGSGTENNDSTRSMASGSTNNSLRRMQRNAFRRTRMFQKSKRNSGSNNNDSGEASLVAKSHISVISQTSPRSDPSASNQAMSESPSSRRAFRGRAAGPSTVEEREAGADSPTFPPPKQGKQASNKGAYSSSTSPTIVQRLTPKQSPQEKVSEKSGKHIPQGHVDNILRFYGGDNMSPASLDLYRDVLKVSPDASDREIRIAYFRRGREILGESAGQPDQPYAAAKANASKLDDATKARFQAVSMAYEILSTPSWKETYLQQGLRRKPSGTSIKTRNIVPQVNPAIAITRTATAKSSGPPPVDPFSSPLATVAAAFPNANGSASGKLQNSESAKPPISPKPINNIAQRKLDVAQRRRNERQMQMQLEQKQQEGQTKQQRLPTALRKSSFTNGPNGNWSTRSSRSTSERSSSSVRWKDHVEELVFACHPNEHASDSESDDSDYDPNEDDNFEDEEICDEEKLRKNTYQNSLPVNGENQAGQFAGPSRRRRRKNKPRIVIDSEELESHLQRMDSEAEKHFVQDFWDNFEESMDGILSLVDSIGGDTPSSWLNPVPPTNSTPKRRNIPRGTRDAAQDATIERSMSHDATMPSKNKVVVDTSNDEFVKRSNSFPLTRSSPSTLDAVSPSPQPSNFNTAGPTVVSPDEKRTTAAKTSLNSRISSPFEIVSNSLPFQSATSEQEDKNDVQNVKKQHKLSPIRVISKTTVVSPSPNSRLKKTSVSSKDGTSTDQDTTVSVASTIFSTSQPQQQFFRPISPCASEASEVAASDFHPAPSTLTSNQKGALRKVDTSADSDEFDINSRLSGVSSVDLTALDNPFRSKVPSSSAGFAKVPQPKPSTNTGVPGDPIKSNDSSDKGEKKKSRFKISMTSTVNGSSKEMEVSSYSRNSQFDQSMEDVFAGVDDDTPLEKYDMADGKNLKVKDIAIKRSSSHMSDLSESVYSSRKENDVGGETSVSEVPTSKPTTEKPGGESVTVTLDASSVLSASTKKSLAGRSQGSTAYTSYASSTRGDTNTVHSSESNEVEIAGFFEYFTAYVSAVMTECANVGTTAGVAEYHQDFLSLFSTDPDAQAAEVREPPTPMRPSVSTKSTASF